MMTMAERTQFIIFTRKGHGHSTVPEPQAALLLLGGRAWLIIIICAFYISVFYCATFPAPASAAASPELSC